MLRASLVLALALATLPATTQGQSIAPLRLGVALGTSFGHNSWGPSGAHAAVSLTSRHPGSRFAIGLEAFYEAWSKATHRNPPFSSPDDIENTVGLMVNATYHVIGRSTGLYVLAGIGMYHRWYEYAPFFDLLPATSGSMGGLGTNIGLGFDFKAHGRELFIESRLHAGAFQNRIPVSLGIRF